ncbi:MAG: Tn7-like element transposition protein TnsE [Reichenbachiella sp.]|uniref:Tn7-like element transposition protein TnsE n=1 Tax=Reichenbachiella sp. TaxID=2184521 RepID=UPI00296650D2|nr:Tn7-like element transposition protein TnsE [Reichenbachiella sp.]MDW3212183.1 Tn7-like element transposition protein TnsE [Reichenbachiella sp.]
MPFEIYCIPSCRKKGKNWFLDAHLIDLKTNDHIQKDFPIAEIPRLPIGAEIKDDNTITRSSGTKEKIHFSDFRSGKTITINELEDELYPFEISDDIKDSTKLFSVNANNKPYIFFCYELFRTFLCMDNRLINYLFQYDVLESFIDHELIERNNGHVHATLTLNESFPKSFLRSNSLLQKYLLLIYDKTFKNLRHSTQAEKTEVQCHFNFSKIDLKNITLTCHVKQYETFNLVYYIESIDSILNFPIDELTIINSSVRSKNHRPNSGTSKPKTFPLKHASQHNTSNTESGNQSSQEEISVLPLDYKFNKKLKIERLRLDKKETSNDNLIGSPAIPQEIIDNLNLSLLQQESTGEGNFLNLNRDRNLGSFDFSEIPEGLITFSKAIKILASTLNKNFTHWIAEFASKSSFRLLNDNTRKAIVVKFDIGMPIYFIEIDSSDNRFISTLVLFNIKTKDHKKFIQLTLNETANTHGRWPEESISTISDYHTIRHPRKRKSDKNIEVKQDTMIERISYKLLNIFTV